MLHEWCIENKTAVNNLFFIFILYSGRNAIRQIHGNMN